MKFPFTLGDKFMLARFEMIAFIASNHIGLVFDRFLAVITFHYRYATVISPGVVPDVTIVRPVSK